MCGIFAVINKEKTVDLGRATKAASLMTHRGPDCFNIQKLSDSVVLAHNRLAILDLNERSNQPFNINHLHIIYNGEVYNYKELVKEHKLNVSTTSDTEVVLLMYQKYGAGCLRYFNGMFCFIIYNSLTKDIFVARDRLGIKPLYYIKNQDGVVFSSEIASLLEYIDKAEFDDFAIRQYKKLRMTLKGDTIYKNIKMFPAGSFYQNDSFSKYWDLDLSPKPPPTDEELKWLINDACLLRKRADVPVGSFLSGGLDSTILSYILQPENTWTVGFLEMNEFEWANLANKKLSSDHHQTIVRKKEFLHTLNEMICKRKEPLSVPNEVLIFLMCKNVKSKNTVVLSGEGADELFWGYDRIFKWANSAEQLSVEGFDTYYCYGSQKDDEVIDFALEGVPGESVLEKVAYFFQIYHLHGLLRRLDNSTMLCSVEARVPFVDHRLVERLAGVPFDWKMGASFKEPLKRVFRDIVPKRIIERPKVGFPVPLEYIFDGKYMKQQTAMDAWLSFNISKLNKNDSRMN